MYYFVQEKITRLVNQLLNVKAVFYIIFIPYSVLKFDIAMNVTLLGSCLPY